MATRGRKKVTFLTSKNSPFADGYDLIAEARIVAHLIEADDPNPRDPLYPRFTLYQERKEMFDRGEVGVTPKPETLSAIANNPGRFTAPLIKDMGSLVTTEADTLTLHTRHGVRMFIGVYNDNQPVISGVPNTAAALKWLMHVSNKDNPVADMLLIKFMKDVNDLEKEFVEITNQVTEDLQALRDMGLTYSILKSSEPAQLSLGFKSPYGYRLSIFTSRYDFMIRTIRSAQARSLLAGRDGNQTVQKMYARVRQLFEPLIQKVNMLHKNKLYDLTRQDWITAKKDPNAAVGKYVETATKLFGQIPVAVFKKEVIPPHSKGVASDISDEDLNLLQYVPPALTESAAAGKADLVE